jgi:hypothetical protein
MVFFIMISHIIDFDVVFKLEFLNFFIDSDLELLNYQIFDFLDFCYEMALNEFLSFFLELLRVFGFH